MAAILFSVDDLLSSMKARGALPSVNGFIDDTDYLLILTEELYQKLLPQLLQTRSEFYLTTTSFPIVSGTAAYMIPSRSAGQSIRSLYIADSAGNIKYLPQVDRSQRSITSGSPAQYYFERNTVVLDPPPNSTSDTLYVEWYVRPSRLIATASCAAVTAIDTTSNFITVSAVPSAFVTGYSIDMLSQVPPHQTWAIDQAITNVSGTDIYFASLPTGLAVGDYLCPAGYSCLPQIPYEMVATLAQYGVSVAQAALGNREAAAYQRAAAKEDTATTKSLVDPREHGQPTVCVPTSFE